jgi:ParB family chromosome partitioning protein
VLQALQDGRISEGHARALLGLTTPQSQSAVLQTITRAGLNVRQTEELVRKMAGKKPESTTKKPSKPAAVKNLEDRLRSRLGTKVVLNPGKKGGTIIIHYYSDEELDTLVGSLLE